MPETTKTYCVIYATKGSHPTVNPVLPFVNVQAIGPEDAIVEAYKQIFLEKYEIKDVKSVDTQDKR
jgi:hypothetical protein